MASSRLHKIGTIYSRTHGLLKSGAMKEADRPLWYDVYEAFPPTLEPKFDRKVEEKPIRPLLYTEDVIRAQFYKKFGSPGTIRLGEETRRPVMSQLFIEEYERLQSEGNIPTEELMDASVLALEERGIYLDRSRAPPKEEVDVQEVEESEPQKEDSKPNMRIRLADVFRDHQND